MEALWLWDDIFKVLQTYQPKILYQTKLLSRKRAKYRYSSVPHSTKIEFIGGKSALKEKLKEDLRAQESKQRLQFYLPG